MSKKPSKPALIATKPIDLDKLDAVQIGNSFRFDAAASGKRALDKLDAAQIRHNVVFDAAATKPIDLDKLDAVQKSHSGIFDAAASGTPALASIPPTSTVSFSR